MQKISGGKEKKSTLLKKKNFFFFLAKRDDWKTYREKKSKYLYLVALRFWFWWSGTGSTFQPGSSFVVMVGSEVHDVSTALTCWSWWVNPGRRFRLKSEITTKWGISWLLQFQTSSAVKAETYLTNRTPVVGRFLWMDCIHRTFYFNSQSAARKKKNRTVTFNLFYLQYVSFLWQQSGCSSVYEQVTLSYSIIQQTQK